MTTVLIVLGLLFVGLVIWKWNLWSEPKNLARHWHYMRSVDYRRQRIRRIPYGAHPRQYLLLCQPLVGNGHRNEVVLYIHGGGWRYGAPDYYVTSAQWLVDQGYTVIMPSHRRTPAFAYPDLREDLNAIWHSSVALLDEIGLGHRPIIVGGLSSGGNLAALLALDNDTQAAQGIDRRRIAGLFTQSAPLALSKMVWSPVLRSYAGSRRSATFKAASPINYLRAQPPFPVLVMHGTKDGVVEPAAARAFVRRYEAAGYTGLTAYFIPGGKHTTAASWAYHDNDVRRVFLDWLNTLSTGWSVVPSDKRTIN